LPTDTWLTVSQRGGRQFVKERRLAPTFDTLHAPFASGYFLGDYQGLTTFADRFRALFVTANSGRPNNGTDVYFTQVRSLDGWRTISPPAASVKASAPYSASTRVVTHPLRLRR
jgi:hypothetical protein